MLTYRLTRHRRTGGAAFWQADARTIRLSARFKPGRAIRLALVDAERALRRARGGVDDRESGGASGEKR